MFKPIKADNARHRVITPVCRLSFPALFTPRAFSEEQAAQFSCDLIFEERDELKEPYKGSKIETVSLMRAVKNVKIDQWGKDESKWPKFKHPVFKDGDDRKNQTSGEVYEGYAGRWFVTAKSSEKYPPLVVGPDGKPADETMIYGGCWVRARLIARPYNFAGNMGVRLLLSQVMKVKDGERFGGFDNTVSEFDVSENSDALENDDDL